MLLFRFLVMEQFVLTQFANGYNIGKEGVNNIGGLRGMRNTNTLVHRRIDSRQEAFPLEAIPGVIPEAIPLEAIPEAIPLEAFPLEEIPYKTSDGGSSSIQTHTISINPTEDFIFGRSNHYELQKHVVGGSHSNNKSFGVEKDKQLEFIINGEIADSPTRYPWFTRVMGPNSRGNLATCGGSLIAPDIVITAAHCDDPNMAWVGAYDLDEHKRGNDGDMVRRNVVAIDRHPMYSDDQKLTIDYDVMLLKLDEPVSTTTHAPITLNFNDNRPALEGDELTILGFGSTIGGPDAAIQFATVLQEAPTYYVPFDVCAVAKDEELGLIYGRSPTATIVQDFWLCTVNVDTSTCYGDSGGPVIQKGRNDASQDILMGVISGAAGYCGHPELPLWNNRISSHQEWILDFGCEYSVQPPDYWNCPIKPSAAPVAVPTTPPTQNPTRLPTKTPTVVPVTNAPTNSPAPTLSPTNSPAPTTSPAPTATPINPLDEYMLYIYIGAGVVAATILFWIVVYCLRKKRRRKTGIDDEDDDSDLDDIVKPTNRKDRKKRTNKPSSTTPSPQTSMESSDISSSGAKEKPKGLFSRFSKSSPKPRPDDDDYDASVDESSMQSANVNKPKAFLSRKRIEIPIDEASVDISIGSIKVSSSDSAKDNIPKGFLSRFSKSSSKQSEEEDDDNSVHDPESHQQQGFEEITLENDERNNNEDIIHDQNSNVNNDAHPILPSPDKPNSDSQNNNEENKNDPQRRKGFFSSLFKRKNKSTNKDTDDPKKAATIEEKPKEVPAGDDEVSKPFSHVNIDHQEMEIQKKDMENNAPSFRKDHRDNSTITSLDTRGEKEAMRGSIPRDLESMAVGVDKDFIKHRALSKRGNHDFAFPRTNDRTKSKDPSAFDDNIQEVIQREQYNSPTMRSRSLNRNNARSYANKQFDRMESRSRSQEPSLSRAYANDGPYRSEFNPAHYSSNIPSQSVSKEQRPFASEFASPERIGDGRPQSVSNFGSNHYVSSHRNRTSPPETSSHSRGTSRGRERSRDMYYDPPGEVYADRLVRPMSIDRSGATQFAKNNPPRSDKYENRDRSLSLDRINAEKFATRNSPRDRNARSRRSASVDRSGARNFATKTNSPSDTNTRSRRSASLDRMAAGNFAKHNFPGNKRRTDTKNSSNARSASSQQKISSPLTKGRTKSGGEPPMAGKTLPPSTAPMRIIKYSDGSLVHEVKRRRADGALVTTKTKYANIKLARKYGVPV